MYPPVLNVKAGAAKTWDIQPAQKGRVRLRTLIPCSCCRSQGVHAPCWECSPKETSHDAWRARPRPLQAPAAAPMDPAAGARPPGNMTPLLALSRGRGAIIHTIKHRAERARRAARARAPPHARRATAIMMQAVRGGPQPSHGQHQLWRREVGAPSCARRPARSAAPRRSLPPHAAARRPGGGHGPTERGGEGRWGSGGRSRGGPPALPHVSPCLTEWCVQTVPTVMCLLPSGRSL